MSEQKENTSEEAENKDVNKVDETSEEAENKDVNKVDETSEEKLCKYCYDTCVEEELICPCRCDGSVKYVHKSCLLKWINVSSKYECSICKAKYRYVESIKNSKFNLVHKFKTPFSIIMYLFVFILCLLLPNILFKYNENIFNIDIQIIFRGIKIFTYIIFIIINFMSRYNSTLMTNIYRNFVNRNNVPNIFSLGYFALYECVDKSVNFIFPVEKDIKIYDYIRDGLI